MTAAFLSVVLAAVPTHTPGPALRVEAYAQARDCFLSLPEPGLEHCRKALAWRWPAARAALLQQMLATKLGTLGRWDEAVEAQRAAVALRPEDGTLQLGLGGMLLFALDRHQDALPALQRAVQLRPESAEAQAALGTALHRTGRHADAVAAFEEAVRLDPDYMETHPAAASVLDAARRGEAWPPPGP